MSKSKVIVSGATGLLGSHILRELLHSVDKYEIIALKRSSSDLSLVNDIYAQVDWVNGDITDLNFIDDICKGADFFIHSAGLISFHKKDKYLLNKINVIGTANVVNACLLNDVKKMIHISSVAALGRPEGRNQISEKIKWETSKNNTLYAHSKRAADMEVYRGQAEGLSSIIIYPATILGKGNWASGSVGLFRRVHDGLSHYTNGINGFVDVRDVAKIAVQSIELNKTNIRVIVSAENRTYQSIFNEMATQFNIRKPTKLLTKNKANFALFTTELFERITNRKTKLSRDSITVGLSEYYYDNSLSKEIFEIEYQSIDESIKDVCAWLLNKDKIGKR